MSKRWKLRPADGRTVQAVAALSGLPLPLARALVLRGQDTPERIERFLNPLLSGLADPFLLPDMGKAVSRIWCAIESGEAVTVFGDYDVDGVTSAAMLTRILGGLGANVKAFIPDRLDEGYGLSLDALERCLQEHGSRLLITVDCGVNSVESVAYAQSCGVDVIVTDHHEPDTITAPAYALINPKLGSVESLKILSGVGVAFKLAHALLKHGRERDRPAAKKIDLRDYLDIVALGTVADIVPLVDENRITVRHGLAAMDSTKWEGMRALKDVAGIRGDIDTYHLGFQLGPRINAAGRIGEPMQALRLLVTDDPAEARKIAGLLDADNKERRKIEQEMAEQAFTEIDAYFDPEKNFGLVVAREDWHPGVVGIVASRVSRHYNRPAIVMGIDDDGSARGSCRSIDEFDLLGGLRACEDLLVKHGGHKMAAGVQIASGSMAAFKTRFNAAAESVLKQVDLSPVQHIDAEIDAAGLDWKFMEQLKRLHPFGQDNPEPVWALRGAELSGQPRVVGQKHLKLAVSCRGRKFDAIAFNYPIEQLPAGPIDIAFTLKENSWNGNTDLQLQISDIAAHQRNLD